MPKARVIFEINLKSFFAHSRASPGGPQEVQGNISTRGPDAAEELPAEIRELSKGRRPAGRLEGLRVGHPSRVARWNCGWLLLFLRLRVRLTAAAPLRALQLLVAPPGELFGFGRGRSVLQVLVPRGGVVCLPFLQGAQPYPCLVGVPRLASCQNTSCQKARGQFGPEGIHAPCRNRACRAERVFPTESG